MILAYEPLQNSPVTLDEMKQFLKVETNEDDALISELIETYTRHVEEVSGYTLRPVQVKFRVLKIDDYSIEAPYRPIASIVSVESEDNVTVTIGNEVFFYTEDRTDKPVVITYQTGASTNTLLKELVRRLVAYAYEHRGEVTEFPEDLQKILKFVRKVRL